MNTSWPHLALAIATALLVASACGVGQERKPTPPQSKPPQKQTEKRHPVGYKGTIATRATGCTVRGQLDPNSPIKAPMYLLEKGTKVKVLQSEPDGARIEVLSGKGKGKQLWIHWPDLK